jgi:signal transduction histidine kinase
MNISNYFCRLCFALTLSILTSFSAHALTVLQADVKKADVSRDIRMWIDRNGSQTIDQVTAIQKDQWQKLTGPMSLGFTSATVWLELKYTLPPEATQRKWVLELDQPLLQNVRMYWRDSSGKWQSQTGTRLDNNTPLAYNYRRPVFDLPTDAQDGQVWLRVSTQTSMSSAFFVWQHDAFAGSRAQESFLWGLVFGSYIFVILFYGMYSFWTRNRLHAVYTVYMLGNLTAAWLTGNWSVLAGISTNSSTLVMLMGLIICWINFLGTLFNMRLLRLNETQPKLSQSLLSLTAAMGVLGSSGVLMGYYHVVIPLVQSSVIGLIAINVYLGVSQLLKHNPNAPLFLWGFSVFYVGIVVRYLRNMGWLEPSFLTEHSYQIGSFVHMLIMSVGIFSSYNRLQRERNDALALADAEYKQREQQAQFLGLVSHELRTPLTIVSTAADNIVQQSKLDTLGKQRLEKIQRAAERMVKIIDGYLNTERLTGPRAKEEKQRIDVLPIARLSIKTAQEKQDHPIDLKLIGEGNYKLLGDALQVQVAIDNLLSNAQSHSEPDVPIELVLRADRDFITITVSNQGDPIAPVDLPHVFERFYRGRNAKNRPGSGLGLHLVQAVATMHNGHVLAENLPEGRCRFTLVLGRG